MTWVEIATVSSGIAAMVHGFQWAIRRLRQVVPTPILNFAIDHVVQAAEMFAENEIRRQWVLKKLLDQGVTENLARLAIETAVQAVKAGGDSLRPIARKDG